MERTPTDLEHALIAHRAELHVLWRVVAELLAEQPDDMRAKLRAGLSNMAAAMLTKSAEAISMEDEEFANATFSCIQELLAMAEERILLRGAQAGFEVRTRADLPGTTPTDPP